MGAALGGDYALASAGCHLCPALLVAIEPVPAVQARSPYAAAPTPFEVIVRALLKELTLLIHARHLWWGLSMKCLAAPQMWWGAKGCNTCGHFGYRPSLKPTLR